MKRIQNCPKGSFDKALNNSFKTNFEEHFIWRREDGMQKCSPICLKQRRTKTISPNQSCQIMGFSWHFAFSSRSPNCYAEVAKSKDCHWSPGEN
jgi:hypothetical protein